MSRINVLVACSGRDIEADGIAIKVADRLDMVLVEGRVLDVQEVESYIAKLPASEPCAVLWVAHADTQGPLAAWLAQRGDLVVLHVEIIGRYVHFVRISLPDPSMESLLSELRGLVDRGSAAPQDRVAHIRVNSVAEASGGEPLSSDEPATREAESDASEDNERKRPLLAAAAAWIHALLRRAVKQMESATNQPEGGKALSGLSVAPETVAALLDTRVAAPEDELDRAVNKAEAVLKEAREAADISKEPLAAVDKAFRLTDLEFAVMLLALAPELDARYQRCYGLLLDELGRRVGTAGLFASLLGDPREVRLALGESGNLVRWRVLEGSAAGLPPADEPLRIDGPLSGWLLGEQRALDRDPRVRRTTRLVPWTGACLIEDDRERAGNIVAELQETGDVQWKLFGGEDTAASRALIELGALVRKSPLVRVDATRLMMPDVGEIEESGVRLGRLARLTRRPLVLDTTKVEPTPQNDDMLRLLLVSIGETKTRCGVICTDVPRIVRLLGPAPYALVEGATMPISGVAGAVRAAAKRLNVTLDEPESTALARRFPLRVDTFELAMRLARAKIKPADTEEERLERFISACKDVAAEGMSTLAERVEPTVKLGDVILPLDRMRQLHEIVDSVRLASKVFDDWKFGEQLPYGRGVTALFHGPSGTGKTMAALAIAHGLGMQVLRLDLSRVVSKYIGDTEKNIDRVFVDAQRSGAAILMDEAEALLGKRSEVKDAHDRYANIEVAYLLQRLEAHEGLAILTSNLRQNIDAAFLRRLRFTVDFPRPDANAREEIWRQCLPAKTHTLKDADFRQLARKVELSGGHIRQITVRAAFSAAAADRKISLEDLAYATRAELMKLGLPAATIEDPEQRKAA